MNLYAILELDVNASQSDIRKAYYKLAKKYHPDKNKSIEAQQKFQEINSAYNILIDDKTRNEYNKMNNQDQNIFSNILSKIFKNQTIIDDINVIKEKINTTDWIYLEKNISNLNFLLFQKCLCSKNTKNF
jgi:DnaJ-class molecular chaperone